MKAIVKKAKSLASTLPGKIAILLFLVVLILVLLIDIFTVTFSTSMLRQNIEDSISTSTFQSGKYFDQILERAKDLSFQLATNETLKKYINVQKTSNDDYEKLEWKKEAQKALLSIISSNKFISSVYILINKESSLGYPTISFDNIDFNNLFKSNWVKMAFESDQGFIWCADHNQYFNDILKEVGSDVRDYSISVVRVLYDPSTGNKIGLIVIDIGKDVFDEMLSNIKITKNGISFVITPDSKIITSKNLSTAIKSKINVIKTTISEKADKKDADIFETNLPDVWIVSYSKSSDSGFIYASLIPKNDITSKISKLQLVIILISLIFGVFVIGGSFFGTLKITKSVKVVLEQMNKASGGNLTAFSHVSLNDEIGILSDGFNKMVSQLRELVGKVKQLSEQVNKTISTIATIASETTAASNEVAKAISEIAEGACSQANEATLISQAMSGFTKDVINMVEDFNRMNKVSEEVLVKTDRGYSAIEVLRQVAGNSQKTTKDMILRVRELIGWVEKINKIMNLLSSISEQTRLLALNATLEAAKAGESGKGFAVVASEIRKLAQQSKDATKGVEEIVKNILSKAKFSEKVVDDVENIIKLQEDSIRSVEISFTEMKNAISDLLEGLQRAIKTLRVIDSKKDKIFNSVENISAVSEETAALSEEVSAATEQQLASIEELQNMVYSLRNLSEELNKAVSVFKVE